MRHGTAVIIRAALLILTTIRESSFTHGPNVNPHTRILPPQRLRNNPGILTSYHRDRRRTINLARFHGSDRNQLEIPGPLLIHRIYEFEFPLI
jgi:hypothetical protein